MNTKEPTESFLRSIDVHELLPQQEPFVMIGTLVKFDMTRTVTELTIPADNLFVDNGYFSASGLIENIAQTCAARIGYVNKYILLKGIQLGFIGAIRNLQVNELPKVGDTITTTVDVLEEVFGMTLANAVVTCGDKVLVTSEMKIAVREAE
ncbi:MAG: pseudouridylate synthase [Bacteroidaceae bacterium]|nr:pseudouridylate synthase [Bacteroidaceae bacterium]